MLLCTVPELDDTSGYIKSGCMTDRVIIWQSTNNRKSALSERVKKSWGGICKFPVDILIYETPKVSLRHWVDDKKFS